MGAAIGNVHPGPVRLLDVELDLQDAIDDEEVGRATRASVVETLVLRKGRWRDATEFSGATLFEIAGLLAGRRFVSDHLSVELVGGGRLFTADARDPDGPELRWVAIEPSWVAVLDREFWREMAPYPGVAAALVGRALDRADSLATRLAIARSGGMPGRLLGLLWELAALRGRVVREGTLIDMPLSTTLLADLLPGSRSRVSDALSELARREEVSRRADRRLVIRRARAGAVEHLSILAPLLCALGNSLTPLGVA